MEENQRIQRENERLGKELEEARSQSIGKNQRKQEAKVSNNWFKYQFEDQQQEMRFDKCCFVKRMPTPEAHVEDRLGASMELQRPGTFEL